MDKCKFYKYGERFECRYDENGRPYGIMAGDYRCYLTEECDTCSCGGDRTKCESSSEIKKIAMYELKGIKTNADRIRKMTDEELAKFISDVAWDEICSECDEDYECQENLYCETHVLKWLQKEIK